MDDGSRKLRGLLGVGTTWGVAWGVIGALIGLVVGMVSPELWSVGNPILEWALGMGAYGLTSGLGFGGLLAYHEQRKTIDDLSPGRAAVWGVLGAVLVPVLFGLLGFFPSSTTLVDVLEAMGVTAVLGGTFAAGSIALARSGARLESREASALDAADAPMLEPARTEEPAAREARERAHERERR